MVYYNSSIYWKRESHDWLLLTMTKTTKCPNVCLVSKR